MFKYRQTSALTLLILLCIVSVFLMRFWLISFHEIHWDEFFILDWLYQKDRAEVINPFTWLFTNFFHWLTGVSGTEVQQIIIARYAFVPLTVLSQVFIFLFARRFVPQTSALFSVLCFASFTFVFQHAFTFRLDVLLVFFLTGALWLSYREKTSIWNDVMAGILLGLAGMVSLKAVFYLPIFIAILLCRARDGKWKPLHLVRLSILPLISLAVFLLLLQWALYNIPYQEALEFINVSTSESLFTGNFFPGKNAFLDSVIINPIYWIIFAVGLICLFQKFNNAKSETKGTRLILVSLLFPLLTLFFYRHTHPYYYIFMLAPASVVVAVGFEKLAHLKLEKLNTVFVILLTLTAARQLWFEADKKNHNQQQVLEVLHNVFPEPVSYIDRCSMMSSFPKSGLFMSYWYLDNYHINGNAIFEDILSNEKPRFVLANINSLDLNDLPAATPSRRLMPEDEQILMENYIHFWGPVYMLGKKVVIKDPDQVERFWIYVAGEYYLQEGEEATIDGEVLQQGKSIELTVGEHFLSTTQKKHVILQFGTPPEQPDIIYEALPLFKGY